MSFCWKLAQVGPNPCNHYYWEDGEDSYVDFLIANGYTVDGIEEKGEENVNAGLQMMDGVMQKMDELIKLCKIICAGLVIVIAVLVYDVLAKWWMNECNGQIMDECKVVQINFQ